MLALNQYMKQELITFLILKMKLKSLRSSIIFPATFLLLCASTTATDAAAACSQTCGAWTLPFPFGFSPGCQIQLNCSSDGTVNTADFPVLSITIDTILVKITAECSRPIETLRRLFTRNYAPSFLNAVLLQDCSGAPTPCFIPSTTMTADFEQLDCGRKNNSISCYSETDRSASFLDYEKLRRSGCRSLFSAISIESSSSASLDVKIVRLGWWILGECSCSEHANCNVVSPPLEGTPPAYRCQCQEGFFGDGFNDGFGCRKEPSAGRNPEYIVIGVAVSVAGVIILCISIRCFLKWRHLVSCPDPKGKQNLKKHLFQNGSLIPKRYKYSEIKKMTKSFSDKLGQGGYGSVYKGMLPDGCPVAVKVLIKTDGDGEEFINEVASISRTSHVNIVTLLGFCYEGNKRAIVYEFMPNKSLDKSLSSSGSVSNTDCCLDLKELYRIAVGIAKGLEYLHTGCATRIVHFDIKPQNILLDDNFCPKISDFGLAKLCKKQQSILSVLGTRGTAGYIAPEVFSRNFGGVSHKSDVYSYGMMVLEMAGARKLTMTEAIQYSENYFPDKIYEQVINDVSKNLDDLVIEDEEETRRKMILVGFWCIQTVPLDRPSISKVVEMLEGSLKSIQIPPKPFLFSPHLPMQEISSTLSSANVETE